MPSCSTESSTRYACTVLALIGCLLATPVAAQQSANHIDFDGVNDYADVADVDSLSFGNGIADSPLTFELWFRPDSWAAGKQNLISKWSDAPNQEYKLYMSPGNTLRLDLRDSSANATVSATIAANLTSLQGSWHHVAVTYDGRGGSAAADGIAFYVDGVSMPVTRVNNAAYVAMENWTRRLQFGRESGGYLQFNGGIDEVRFWSVARTALQIQTFMSTELAGVPGGLVAYWKFNEGSGTSSADSSLHGLAATVYNGALWLSESPVGPAAADNVAPEIQNVTASNPTHNSVTISYSTNEPTTATLTLMPNGACPCTDFESPGVDTQHSFTIVGLSASTFYGYQAKATDLASNLTVAPQMDFTTQATPPDTIAPTVSITAPAPGQVMGLVDISASAQDANGVQGVQFMLDGAPLGPEDLAAPFTINWDTTNVADGTHTIGAVARDAAGNLGSASIVVSVANDVIATTTYVDFDGANDYVDVVDVDSLSFGNGAVDSPLTFELWFRPDSWAAGKQSLISKWSDAPNQEYKLYMAPGNTLRLDLRDSSAQATVSAMVAANLVSLQGTWHHVAVTYDGRGGPAAADGVSFYIDGVAMPVTRINHAAYLAMENWTRRLQIGRESGGYLQYNGGLDEVRFWNVVRTEQQVQTYMTRELSDVPSGLVAYWKFNEGSGTTSNDHSLNGLTAFLYNGVAWMTDGPILTLQEDEAPTVSSQSTAVFQLGSNSEFVVTTDGFPPPALSVSGALPDGVSFSDNGNGTATIVGAAAPGTSGTYPLTITAVNGVGSPATQNFTLTVVQSPVFQSAAAASFRVLEAGSFQISATGFPTPTISFSGSLPSGVSFLNNGDGTASLSGTPASGSAGTYPLMFTAVSGPSASTPQSFVLTVTQDVAIVSAPTTTTRVGVPATFNVVTSGFPTPAIALTGALPNGLTFTDNGNGTASVSGTPAPGSGGSHAITFTASNGASSSPQSFTLIVQQPPSITSAASAAFPATVPSAFAITTGGFPAPALSLTGTLPEGVSFADNGNGQAMLSGTPSSNSGGSYALTMTADNGVSPAAVQPFTLTVQSCTLSPPAGTLASATFGVPYLFNFSTAGGSGHSYAISSGAVPAGLTFSNGSLSGTPTTTGAFGFTVTVTAPGGCFAANAYSLAVVPDAGDEVFVGAVGNTQYSVGAGAPPTPAVAVNGSVLSNDSGPGTLSAGPAIIASANGGSVAMSAQGAFVYTPPVGFAGPADSFTYILTDGNGVTDAASVTIQLGGVVWYVNAAAGAGDGRSNTPFNSLSAVSAAAGPGHVIYVHQGSPSGALLMKPNQALWGAGSLFTLGGLVIPPTATPALQGTLTLANNVVVNAIAVNGLSGNAIAASGLAGSEQLNAVSIVGGAAGISLSNVSGSLVMSGGNISGVTGPDVYIVGGNADVTVGANITNTAGRSVEISNRTGGNILFSGAISDTGTGILFAANAGSVSFTGGLTLSTGANTAFSATGGGTVTVTQDNVSTINTITTTQGVALQVLQTDIGTAGLTFRRISAGTDSYSPGNGIILNTTGMGASNGGLTITGAGTPQSGGVIRRKSGPNGSLLQGVGIYLNSTKNVALNWVDLNRLDNSGIVAHNVNGFLLANSRISIAGTAVGIAEGPLVFGNPSSGISGVFGSVTLRDSIITDGVEDNVAFYGHSGSATVLIERTTGTPGDCHIGPNHATTGRRGLSLQTDGDAIVDVTVNRCRIRANRVNSVYAAAAENSSMTLLITGSATDGQLKSEITRGSQGQDGAVLTNSGNASLTATIENAIITGWPGSGIRIGQAIGNASSTSMLRVSALNNFMESPVGSVDATIVARLSSTVGDTSHTRILIAHNNGPSGINQYGMPAGIRVETPDEGTSPLVDLTLIDDHIDMREGTAGSGVRGPIGIDVQATRGTMCMNVTANTSHWYPSVLVPQGGGIRLQQSGAGQLVLERGGSSLESPASQVLAASNPAPPFTLMVTEALGNVGIVENGTCLTPSTP